ncbi:MAG: hypothetical protein P1P89_05470 [Desulfobacterales bacterium]|nr:hypothetical protein [Desulfobacterales bacterium]
MKKTLIQLLSLSLVISLISLAGCAAMKAKDGSTSAMAEDQGDLEPVVVVATPNVAMDKKSEVILMGTGFDPGSEIIILITDADGVLTDIGSELEPEPKADATGTWGTTWNAGRYISKKLIKKGAYAIQVTDSDYNPIAITPVNFYEKPKKDDKKDKK